MKIKTTTLYFALFINQAAYSYGSYLFCTNTTAPKSRVSSQGQGWNWAKGSNNNNSQATPIDNYPTIAKTFSQGTWLSGIAGITTNYLMINQNFDNQTAAINFCEALKQKCQSDWGETFTGVGASSWDIPIIVWGSIAVRYKNQFDNYQWLACKNWKHTNHESIYYNSENYAHFWLPLKI